MSFSFAIHIIFLNIIYVLELVLIDASNGFKVYSSPSNNLHVTIGGTVGAFVIVVIGVVIAIIVKRYVSGRTFADKKIQLFKVYSLFKDMHLIDISL